MNAKQLQPNTVRQLAPEFLPIPPVGVDPVFGLSRSSYYKLERANAIRLCRVRKPGQLLGKVLIDCNSVRKYFSTLMKQQAGEQAAATEGAN